MEPELKQLIDDVQAAAAQWRADADTLKRHDKTLTDLLSRVDMLATFGGGPTKAGGASERPTFPSLKSWRAALEQKDARIGNEQDGGYLVIDEGGAFHDRMRPANVILQAEPLVVDMDSLSVLLPGLSDSTTVYATGEQGTISESAPQVQQRRLTAHKYTCRTIASAELLADSNPSARQIIAEDHARQLANRLDLDMLEGNGTSIIGLRRKAGVAGDELGSPDGAAPTLDDIADSLYRLEAANADLSRVRLIMHPRTWNYLRKQKDSGGDGRFLLTPNPTMDARRTLFGVPVLTSSQISITETVGASTDCSYVIACDFSKVVVGRRLDVAVLYDPYSKSSTDQIVIQSQVRYDLALLHAAACDVLTGVRATA